MQLKSNFGVYRRPAILALCLLAGFSLSRILLVAIHWSRVAPTEGLGFILLQGVRFDLILVASLLGPVFLFRPWFHLAGFLRAIGNWLFPLYLAFVTTIAFFVEASTASFIGQFDSRPNYIFVEYLEFPKEVFATVAGTKPVELAVFTLAALFLGWSAFRWMRKDPFADQRVAFWFPPVMMPLVAVIMLAMIRSSTGHRPINPSNAAFSQDSMVNQLPLNSPYSVLHAIYEHRKEMHNERIRYPRMDEQDVMDIVLEYAGITPEMQVDPTARPTLHAQEATFQHGKPLNLVIVLLESQGATYTGSLGGKDLTPNLDGLQDEGIWFERLYATGQRSARGIEAILTGFTPSPMTNVVKRSDTQAGFFTLPALLAEHGYESSFIYGGESHFDNMRRFFLNNGFDEVIDEHDFENAVYEGTWGYSDEDLFNMAHEKLSAKGDQPFFSLIFTSSHHEPFDIPAGRVPESEYGPQETSINYADYALGQFLEKARNSNYWDNTVFMVVADHNWRIWGGKYLPVEHFRIPGVIFGPSIEPRRVPGIASQIDLVPTLLSLIGVDGLHPAIGRDLTRPEFLNGSGRAQMQFHADQAWMEGERIVVFRPDLDPISLLVEEDGNVIEDPDPDPELVRRALAHAQFAPLMIKRRAYRL